MRIFALSDPHLALYSPEPAEDGTYPSYKTMDIFGSRWQDHTAKLVERWQDSVGPEDLVLIAGDISWAMTLTEAKPDLEFLGNLKGYKILIKGNHDYWWHGIGRIRATLPPKMMAIQNDAISWGDVAITGSRLWNLPGSADFKEEDRKIYERELIRLEMSLRAGGGRPLINMTHYAPCNEDLQENEVVALLRSYGVGISIYGHYHDKREGEAIEGHHWDIDFYLTSCDYLDFTPKLIAEV